MSGAVQSCSRGTRHAWTFVKNIQIWRIGPRTGSMKVRGLYQCACGQKKHGQAQYKDPDHA